LLDTPRLESDETLTLPPLPAVMAPEKLLLPARTSVPPFTVTPPSTLTLACTVMVPAPTFTRLPPPLPLIEPWKNVVAPLDPAVSVAAPRSTMPLPESDPSVWLCEFNWRLAP